MKRTQKLIITGVALTLISISFTLTSCTEGLGMDGNDAYEDTLLKSELQSADLTDAEIEGILFMREEEKLARDVYRYLYEIYPLRPFLNISKSEQAHMNAIKYLIDTYGLEDPVGENDEGVFISIELQELYDELIATGSASRIEALKVGALIEEVDILDLRHELDQSAQNEDVIRVFGNLCKASEAHLRAFVRVLRIYDVEYEPVKLEQENFDRILGDISE